jgi:DNA repair exonuclease SbcCD ATPase subunit
MNRSSRRPLASWMVLGLVLGSLPAVAEYRDDYKRGLEALANGEWMQAAALLRQVVAEQPEERARLARSPFSRRYLPHFYLGQALLGMGDCDGALVAWAESERQGVVSALPEYRSLVEGRESCRQQMAARSESQRQAEMQIANAEAAAERVNRLKRELSPDWESNDTSLGTRQGNAENRLLSARSQLASAVAVEDIQGMRRAGELAREAREQLEAVEREVIQLQAQLRLQQGALISEVESLLEQAESELRATASLRPYPRQLGQAASEVSELIDRGRRLGRGQDLGSLREFQGDLETALARLQEAAAPPPAALTDAARAYFDGDYEEVLELLEGLGPVSRRIELQAHMLRAAASFTLFQLSGPGGTELLDAARAEVRSCLEIDPARRPPTGPFSPKFIDFFDSLAAATDGEATVAQRPTADGSH